MSLYKAIDMNLNKACEKLNVLENLGDFYYEDIYITKALKNLKNKARVFSVSEYLKYSESKKNTIEKSIDISDSFKEKVNMDILIKNTLKDIEESFRVVEEFLKIQGHYEESLNYKELRLRCYDIERKMVKKRFEFEDSIYAILGEEFSNGRDNIVLTQDLIKSGVKIIQYREKNRSKEYKLKQCEIIRKLTKEADVTFIVNDDIDIALLVKADGIHLGQEDLKPSKARELAPNMIIGLSTHNKTQALKALELYYKNVIDYIGVGPMFSTTTKKDVEKSQGLNYLKWVSENINMPYVAIGGIKENLIESLVENGGNHFALISELIGSENIEEKVKSIKEAIERANRG
ncbi:MAG: thiamine phosphate synthase [Clostridium sp.]